MRPASFLRVFPVALACGLLHGEAALARSLDPLTDFYASGQVQQGDRQTLPTLLAALRDYGDYDAVLTFYDPEMHKGTVLRAAYATALAAAGETDRAREELDGIAAEDASEWVFLAEALIARRADRLDAAEAAVAEALELAPENAYAHNIAGSIDAVRADWPAAATHFEESLRLAPESAVYAANLGGALLQAGAFAEAQGHLDAAIALNPGFCAPRLARATLFDLQGNLGGVVGDLSTCLAGEQNPVAARALVEALTAGGRLSEAGDALQRHAALLGSDAPTLEAELALRQGDGARALAALERAVLQPEVKAINVAFARLLAGEDAEARATMADVQGAAPQNAGIATLLRGFDVVTGETSFSAEVPETPLDALWALLATPDAGRRAQLWAETANIVPGFSTSGLDAATPDALAGPGTGREMARGMLYLARGLNLPAAASFAGTAEQAGTSAAVAPLRYLEAAALARARQGDAAEAALRLSLEASPSFVSANVFLGDILAREARFAEAIAPFEAAFAMEPTAAHALRVGTAAEMAGEVDAAIGAYRAVIAALPESHVGYNQLAWVLVSSNRDLAEAEALARAGLERAPGDGPTLDTLGWAIFLQGRAAEALPYLRQAYEAGGSSAPLIAFHLAQAEAAAGDPDRARELLDLILSHGESAFVFSEDARRLRETL